LLLLLPVILSFAQNLRRCLFSCFSFPKGICFCFCCHSERSEESPHLLMLLPVILAQPESPSFYVLWFVVPAGNLLLSLPVLNLQLKTYNFPVVS